MKLVSTAVALSLAFTTGCASGPPAAQGAVQIPVPSDAKSQGGLRYVDVAEGKGNAVSRGRCVYAHYTGWLPSGTQFESSRTTASAATVPTPVAFVKGAGKVMPGWEAGFEGMRAGGTRRLFIPYRMAYGSNGNPPVIPPRTDLIFDVELLAVQDAVNFGCPPLRY